MTPIYRLFFYLLILTFMPLGGISAQEKQMYVADPTIFSYQGIYYLYGTGDRDGFKVYTSKDTKSWKDEGFALRKGDAFGTSGFWAPQVFQHRNKFYMAYVANEHIAIAQSDSPLGPFKQQTPRALEASTKIIDPFIFKQGNRFYLYYVRLQQGNRIFVATLKPDFSGLIAGTERACISATEPWENTAHASWPVTEGPSVLRHNGLYYLFYSANDFRNIDYAVGYAVSKSLLGPWKKMAAPILSRKETRQNGSGHGDFFFMPNGKLSYVFHTHHSNEQADGKRKTAIVETYWKKPIGKGIDSLKVSAGSFRYLQH